VDLALDAGAHTVDQRTAVGLNLAGPPSPLEDCAASDRRPPTRLGSRAEMEGNGTIRLVARAHSSCVWLPIGFLGPGARYQMDLSYRTVSGLTARVCLWEVGPDRCAPVPVLDTGPGWHALDAEISPDPSTKGLRLYLYADGQSPRTVTEYRDTAIRPTAATRVSVRWIGPPAPAAPALTWDQTRPDRYRVSVAPTARPFVLVLDESFARGWRLNGLPPGSTARHFVANGYANGWLITPDPRQPPRRLVLSYPPELTATAAQASSGAALLLAVVGGAVGLARSRRRDRETSAGRRQLDNDWRRT
jgi:arabinofuranan 3-O-arabinosyltransferase